jgi:hypothetical protein
MTGRGWRQCQTRSPEFRPVTALGRLTASAAGMIPLVLGLAWYPIGGTMRAVWNLTRVAYGNIF